MNNEPKKTVETGGEGPEGALFNQSMEQYAPLRKKMVSLYSEKARAQKLPFDQGDLIQEADLAFYRAFQTYRSDNENVSFGLYAKICIRNALSTQLRKWRREKRDLGSAREEAQNEQIEGPSRENAVSYHLTPEMERKMEAILSPAEYRIFHLRLSGKKPREIAESLMIPPKSVWNTISRAKAKLKKEFSHPSVH